MRLLLKGCFTCWFMMFSFYSLTPENTEFVNALEDFKYSIEDMDLTAGVEGVFDTEVVYTKEYAFDTVGYTTARLNVRENPSMDSEVIEILEFNTEIKYDDYDEEWAVIKHNDVNGYVSKKYISDEPANYTSYNIPSNSGFKSYMPYNAITNKSSKQYKLQQRAYTGKYGIRMVDGRYCVALGTYFKKEIGTYFDLVLKNGKVIKCVLGDIKSSAHTYEDNITSFNGCVSEFIVDTEHLNKAAKASGDISSCNSSWDSPVVKINIY